MDTNLPTYFAGVPRASADSSASTDKISFTPKSHDPGLDGLKSGDLLTAVIDQEITASPEVPTPIRARVTSRSFRGSYFLGEATLERELHRVLLSFTKIRISSSAAVFQLKATGLSPTGSVGLTGDYESQTGMFFLGELASAGAAGFLDSTINRNQTTLGNYVQEPSLSNSGKAAAVTALSKTTDRMAEGVRQTPGFTHVAGYQEIQILIQTDPSEDGS